MRLTPLTPETAEGKARLVLGEVYERHGSAGPMTRAMANSPALLRGYLDLSRATKRITVARPVSERISIALQQQIGCEYCLAAHTRAGRALGIEEAELDRARRAESEDLSTEKLMRFAVDVYREPKAITDDQLQELRGLGFTDRQVADTVALVALNVLTGSFNLVAGVEVNSAEAELENPDRESSVEPLAA